MTTRSFFSALLIIATACGGAGENDPDRTSLAARAPHDVMWNDTSVLPTAAYAGAGGGKANGADVFMRCAVCHQSTGQGMPGAYPPLAGSEWLLNNPQVPIRIVLHGLQGSITVKGTSFNSAMTPFGEQLSDAEIAAVLSYERASWGNNAAPITAEQVATVRAATKAQTAPSKPDDLKGLINGK